MLPPVFALLSTAPAVTALLGAGNAARVYSWGEAKPDVARPYVTWMLVAGTAENTQADAPPVDRYVIQMDCWGDTGSSAKGVAAAVRDVIETTGYVVAYNPSDRDPETGRYRMSFDVEIHVRR